MIKHYLEIIKPGIILGNLILITGSFLFASSKCVNYFLFFFTILGASLVIASGCIFNNLIDSDIDKKMTRTRNRVLSKNLISPISVLVLAFTLGILGLGILGIFVNFLSMFFAILGLFIYVVLYTIIYKRTSIYSTFIGSLSGSTPSLIGYTAATNRLDLFSILLFIIFIFWQMSHFYSISIMRIHEYQNANIPVYSVLKGPDETKKHVFFYILCFIFCTILLTFLGYLSKTFLFFSLCINFYWLFLSFCDMCQIDNNNYTRKVFYCSIFVVFSFNFLLAIDFLFP